MINTNATRTNTTANTTALPDTGTRTTTTAPTLPDITTTTTTYPYYYVELETVPGFYFSHDDGTRGDGSEGGFSKEQVQVSKYWRVDTEESDPIDVTDTFDPTLINYHGATPQSVYNIDNKNFTYGVYVYYGDELLYTKDEDGKLTPVYITAFIGVKGDVNFDNQANAVDASQVQTYYARLSSTNEGYTPENTYLSDSELVGEDPLSIYDDFAAFLGDIDTNEWASDNWKVGKKGRALEAVDSTGILVFYALISATKQDIVPTVKEAWDIAAPFRFGDAKYTQETNDKFASVIN
ncbi:MAG: cellulose-binding protein CttA-related protein [Ruminococcus sp.]|nr:cellulose-binding protein CttA-related protein [Ruminococcus sp.]